MTEINFGGPKQQTYIILNIIFCSFGFLASLINIVLIKIMKLNSGHISLVLFMNYSQLIYDFTLFFSNVYCGYYILNIANFFQLTFGISGSLISNWIAYVAFYVVYYNKNIDINSNKKLMYLSSFLPGLINGIILLGATIPQKDTNFDLRQIAIVDIYYYIRLASILLNFLFAGLTLFKIYKMGSKRRTKSFEEIAIQTFSYRLLFYPIIQAVGRLGNAWYEKAYGEDYDNADDASTTQYDSLLFVAILTPLVSVGYLIIFLIMQPSAYKYFKRLFGAQIHIEKTNITTTKASFINRSTAHSVRLSTAHTSSVMEDPSGFSKPSIFNTLDYWTQSVFKKSEFDPEIYDLEDEDLLNIIENSTPFADFTTSESNHQTSNPIQEENFQNNIL